MRCEGCYILYVGCRILHACFAGVMWDAASSMWGVTAFMWGAIGEDRERRQGTKTSKPIHEPRLITKNKNEEQRIIKDNDGERDIEKKFLRFPKQFTQLKKGKKSLPDF